MIFKFEYLLHFYSSGRKYFSKIKILTHKKSKTLNNNTNRFLSPASNKNNVGCIITVVKQNYLNNAYVVYIPTIYYNISYLLLYNIF